MPELPEVASICAGLTKNVVGKTIREVEILELRCADAAPGKSFADVVDQKITGVGRRGKFGWFTLSNPGILLSFHLRMSGQLLVLASHEPLHKHCRVVLGLDNQLDLRYHDQRKFGHLRVDEPIADPWHLQSQLPACAAKLAPDVLEFSDLQPEQQQAVLKKLQRSSRAIKQVLLDQNLISGIGNIYADECLFYAKIHPETPASALSGSQLAKILQAAKDVMLRSLAVGGTSFDSLYVGVNGDAGYFARELAAYGRGGQPCVACGTAMHTIKVQGRSTTYCPQCQSPL